jgi:hypothetical protein
MYFNNRKLDIRSRGEITDYLKILLKKDQIKDCLHLKIEEGYLSAFYTKCTKEYASRIPADNVHTDPSAGGAPSSYFWPKCPKDCPYYSKSEVFIQSLNREVEEIYNHKSTYEVYVNSSRIQELNNLKKKVNKFDLIKLIKMCEELNKCYSNECFMAVIMLNRSILNHVPPIFNEKTFKEVLNNYKSPKSFKDSMDHLEKSSRKIADSYLHIPIRKNETLPNATQVNFRNDLDVLLGEIVRIL